MCVCVRSREGTWWEASSELQVQSPPSPRNVTYVLLVLTLLVSTLGISARFCWGGGDSAEQTRIGYLEKGDCQGLVTC